MMDNSFSLQDSSPRSSRRTSIAGSAYSQAASTRHMLSDYDTSSTAHLNPPRFAGLNSSSSSFRSSAGPSSSTGLSLMVNYLPDKFSSSLLSRKGGKRGLDINLPKRGGGIDAFKSNEDRMGGKRLRWTKFKWILFFMNFCLTIYSLVSLVVCLLTWFDVWEHADIIRVANRPELIISTIAASVGILTSLVGWAGILLNNRGFLATFTFLTWITFAFLVTPGYISYRKRTYNLEGKVNAQWSRALGAMGRMRIQNQLECCGYFSPFVEATVSQTCYARSILPGCKGPYLKYQRKILTRWFTASFALVPLHLLVMLAGLLCSNHVTYRFGKGMMPEAYRLNMNSMAAIMDNYANQLADQYGTDVATKVLERSRSNLNLASPSKNGQQ